MANIPIIPGEDRFRELRPAFSQLDQFLQKRKMLSSLPQGQLRQMLSSMPAGQVAQVMGQAAQQQLPLAQSQIQRNLGQTEQQRRPQQLTSNQALEQANRMIKSINTITDPTTREKVSKEFQPQIQQLMGTAFGGAMNPQTLQSLIQFTGRPPATMTKDITTEAFWQERGHPDPGRLAKDAALVKARLKPGASSQTDLGKLRKDLASWQRVRNDTLDPFGRTLSGPDKQVSATATETRAIAEAMIVRIQARIKDLAKQKTPGQLQLEAVGKTEEERKRIFEQGRRLGYWK